MHDFSLGPKNEFSLAAMLGYKQQWKKKTQDPKVPASWTHEHMPAIVMSIALPARKRKPHFHPTKFELSL